MTRRGFALPAALAALVVLSALATLASVAARVSLREASALADEAQAAATRAAIRARTSLALLRTARDALIATPRLIGTSDTTVTAVELAWPWHRVTVTVAGATVIAELARAVSPPIPWCAAIVTGGVATIAAGAVSLDGASSCTELQRQAAPAGIDAFADSLAADLVLAPAPDSVVVYAAESPAVIRARRHVVLGPGASVSGVVMAPVVTLEPGASVCGIIIANDTVTISVGAVSVGDEHAAQRALAAYAKLQLLGRAGLLLPP